MNFALYAKHAKGVELCVYDKDHNLVAELPLDPSTHKTGRLGNAPHCPHSGVACPLLPHHLLC